VISLSRTALWRNLRFFGIVLRHKWYVFIECCKLGIPWRGIMHDWSKFSPGEWRPRVEAYARGRHSLLDAEGNIDPQKVSEALALSWLRHYHSNPHHWQWWVVVLDNGTTRVLPMDDAHRREMLADWNAIEIALGTNDTPGWYIKNREKMLLHPETAAWVEKQLGLDKEKA